MSQSLVRPITMLTNLVIVAVKLMKMSRRHDTSVYLACSYHGIKCPSYNICPIGRNKKREENFFHHLTCHATVHQQMKTAGVCHYAKEFRSAIWKSPFRFLSTGIFGITFGRTGLTEICRSVFDKPVSSLPCFPYVGEWEKE